MLDYTLDHAQGSRNVQELALSSDAPELLRQARTRGVAAIERPAELATDTATVADAARHATRTLEAMRGERFQSVVILYGNVPIRPANLTDRALTLLRETGCTSVQSVCPVGKRHPYWMRQLDVDGRLSAFHPNTVDRRQNLPPVYALDGGVLAVRREMLDLDDGPHGLLGADPRAILTAPHDVIDIDEELDVYLAEAVLRQRASISLGKAA